MNRSTLLIIRLCFAVITLAIVLNRCYNNRVKQYQVEHTWTPEMETQLRDMLMEKLSSNPVSDSVKSAYIDCYISKIREMLPHGPSSFSEEEMNDSTRTALKKASAECVSSLIWTAEAVQKLEQKFYAFPEVKQLPDAALSEYVNCLAFRVETKFPKGLNTVARDSVKQVIMEARRECTQAEVSKYKVQKKIVITE